MRSVPTPTSCVAYGNCTRAAQARPSHTRRKRARTARPHLHRLDAVADLRVICALEQQLLPAENDSATLRGRVAAPHHALHVAAEVQVLLHLRHRCSMRGVVAALFVLFGALGMPRGVAVDAAPCRNQCAASVAW